MGRGWELSTAWHAGRYDRTLLGIFQVGNLTSVAEEAGAEVIILEEPEHLTWYHHGPRWTEKFDHVVRSPQPRMYLAQQGALQALARA